MSDVSTGLMLFDQWAPGDSVWSQWAKPALFAQLRPGCIEPATTGDGHTPVLEQWALRVQAGTGVVLDVPGDICIPAALQLARMGFRPVPLFNVTTNSKAVVDVLPIMAGLYSGGSLLQSMKLVPQAPPAFMIDSRRCPTSEPELPGEFDNRWIVFPQDFPSANFLISQNIASMVWAHSEGGPPAPDLAQVLRRWQLAGITILSASLGDTEPPGPLDVPRPPMFRMMWQRALAAAKLGRNSVGGFGTAMPFRSFG